MKRAIVAGLLISFSTLAIAGGGSEVGNATDNLGLNEGSAWFFNTQKTISSCYVLGDAFPVPAPVVESDIRASFATWVDYLQNRGVQSLLQTKKIDQGFATNLEIRPVCRGDEDLRLMFGFAPSELGDAAGKLDHPTAAAIRTEYDDRLSWGKGFIWFAKEASIAQGFPNWSKDSELRAVLLHELGHVFGNPHVRGTIMDENLSAQLRDSDQRAIPFVANIDQRNQLLYCWNCESKEWAGSLGYSDSASRDRRRDVFKRFVGRFPIGSLKSTLRVTPQKLQLQLTDDGGTNTIDLSFNTSANSDAIHSAFDRGERVLKAVWRDSKGREQLFDVFSGGTVEYGSIRDSKGQKLNLVLEVNSHSLGSPGPLTLRWLEDGVAHSLFFSDK